MAKVPYLAIIGDREVTDKKLAVRSKKKGDKELMEVEDLIRSLSEEIALRLNRACKGGSSGNDKDQADRSHEHEVEELLSAGRLEDWP